MNANVESIFNAAVEKTGAERDAFLAETCGGDSQLKRRVEALLRASDDAGSFLERSPADLDATQAADSDAGSPEMLDRTVVDTSALARDSLLEFLAPAEKPDTLGRLGQYEVLQIIGRGGMGVVLRALDPKLNRVVAIKVLAPELAANGMARQRFQREAQAAAAVSHPHVVTIHAVDDAETVPYIVMECVDGQSLQDKIARKGALEMKEILRIGSQIAQGLAAAHAQGLIHRDVKPGNVLLENGVERVKLTDFGLARAVDDVGMTQTGVVAGTPQYMSPEQAEGRAVDHRSDLFSLGSVLYAMCTGRPPFRAESTIAVLRRVCDDTPRPIREVNPEIPAWLADIIDRLLEKDPAKRIQTAKEVADLLSGHLAHLQHPATPPPVFPVLKDVSVTDFVGRKGRSGRKRSDSSAGSAGRSSAIRVAAGVILLVLIALGFTEATGVTRIAATIIRIARGDGTLVVEVDDPNVSVSIEGEELVITGAGPKEIRVKPGTYTVKATRDGKPVYTEIVKVERNGRRIVRIGVEPLVGRAVADAAAGDDFTLVRKFEGHTGPVKCVAYSPDGRLLASASGLIDGDQTVRLWDVQTGRLLRTLPHAEQVLAVRFSPDGRHVLSAGTGRRPRLWAVDDGRLVREFTGGDRWINDVAFSPDGHRVLCCGDSTVFVWDFQTGEKLHALAHGDSHVLRVAVTPDNRQIVSANRDGQVLMWDLESGEFQGACPEEVAEQKSGGCGLALLDGGERALVGNGSRVLRLWDLTTGRLIRSIDVGISVHEVAVTPDGRIALACGNSGKGRPWRLPIVDLETGRLLASHEAASGVTWSLAVSPSGREFVTAGGSDWRNGQFESNGDYALRLWRLPESAWPQSDTTEDRITLAHQLTGHTDVVRAVQILLDGKHAVSVARDDTVRTWNIETGKEVDRFEIDGYFSAADFSEDGRLLAVGTNSNKDDQPSIIEVWDLETKQRLQRLEADFRWLSSVVLSPDGRHLSAGGEPLAAGKPTTVTIWDVVTGQPTAKMELEKGARAFRQAFSLDGKQLAVATGKPIGLSLWDVTTAQKLRDYSPSKGRALFDVAFSPNGAKLVASYSGGGLDLFDVQNSDPLAFYDTQRTVYQMAFLDAGVRLLIAGGRLQPFQLLDLETSETIAATDVGKMIWNLDVSADATFAVTGGGESWNEETGRYEANGDYTVRLWRLPESVSPQTSEPKPAEINVVRKFEGHTGHVNGVAYLPDGKQVVSLAHDKSLRVWDVETGTEARRIELPEDGNYALAVSPDGELAAAVVKGTDIVLCDLSSGELVGRLEGHTDRINSLDFSSDGQLLVSRSRDKTAKVWSVDEQKEVDTTKFGTESSLARFIPGSTRWVSTSGGSINTFNVSGDERRWNDVLVEKAATSLAISDDGTLAAVGGHGRHITVVALADLSRMAAFECGERPSDLAFLPGTHLLVSGSFDKTLRVWDAKAGTELARGTLPNHGTNYVAVSPDGTHAVTGGGQFYENGNYGTDRDYALRLWRLPESVWPEPSFPRDSAAFILTSDENEWSEPVNLGPRVNGPESDSTPWISGDGLTLLFTSTRPGGEGAFDVWRCTRSSVDEGWSEAVNLGPPINSLWLDGWAQVSDDGRTLVFVSTRPSGGQGAMDLWTASRESADAKWQEPVNLGPSVNSPENDVQPSLSGDGLQLIFVSNRRGAFEHWITKRKSLDDKWSAPELLSGDEKHRIEFPLLGPDALLLAIGNREIALARWDDAQRWTIENRLPNPINDGHVNTHPFFDRATNTLYFTSERPGGLGETDLWMSRRVKKQLAESPFPRDSAAFILTSDEYEWSEPVNLSVNGADHDGKPWVSEDGRVLLFASVRSGGEGARDIWQSTRPAVDDPWSEPINLGTTINTQWYDSHPYMTPDGRTLVFVSTRPERGEGAMDLWMATRKSAESPWSEAVNLGDVNSLHNEMSPSLSPDRRHLIFVSNRSGRHLFYFATRASADVEWSRPQPLTGTSEDLTWYSQFESGRLLWHMGEWKIDFVRWDPAQDDWVFDNAIGPPINEGPSDAWPWFHRPTNTLYWQSNRPGGKGDDDLWMSRRVKREAMGAAFPLGSVPFLLTSDEYPSRHEHAGNLQPDGVNNKTLGE